GSVFAAGIIAEIGQIERFEDETKIAKYAGLYWRKHQSGRFTAEDTSLTRNGNQYLRYYLVEAANSVRRHVPECKDYYAKKYQEVPKHQHKRALALTARKLGRLRSEEHTSELQSRFEIVFRRLLEKKKKNKSNNRTTNHDVKPQRT